MTKEVTNKIDVISHMLGPTEALTKDPDGSYIVVDIHGQLIYVAVIVPVRAAEDARGQFRSCQQKMFIHAVGPQLVITELKKKGG